MKENQWLSCIGTLDISTGTALAFVAYPAAIAKMPGSIVWAILFFLMLMMLGLGTMCISVHTIVTGIIDEYPRQLYKHRLKVLLAICVAMYLMGLPFLSQVSDGMITHSLHWADTTIWKSNLGNTFH